MFFSHRIIFLISFIFLSNIANAQLIPFRNGEIWGAIDREENEVIPFNYDEVSFFSEGTYLVRIKNTYGLMDEKGKYILQCENDGIIPFSENHVQVIKDGKSGLFTLKGKEVLPISYQGLRYLKDVDLIEMRQQKKYGVVDFDGKEIIKLYFDGIRVVDEERFIVRESGKYMLIDRSMQSISKEYFNDLIPLEDDYFLLRNNQLWGCIDRDGNQIIPVVYDQILKTEDGFFQVRKENAFGLYTVEGNELLFPEFETPIFVFDTESIWAKSRGEWKEVQKETAKQRSLEFTKIDTLRTYIRASDEEGMLIFDKNQKQIFEKKYHEVRPYNSKVFAVQMNKKWAFVNFEGEELSDFIYDEIYHLKDKRSSSYRTSADFDRVWDRPFNEKKQKKPSLKDHEMIGKVRIGTNWALVNGDGELLTDAIFDEIGLVSDQSPIWYKQNGRYGAMDLQGYRLLDPIYESVEWNVERKVFKIETSKKIGWSDKNGKQLVAPKYENLSWEGGDQHLLVKQEGKWGMVNLEGKTVIPIELDRLFGWEDYVMGVKENKVILFSNNGETLVPRKYDGIELLKNAQGKVIKDFLVVRNGYAKGVINKAGKEIVPVQFDIIYYSEGGLVKAEKSGQAGYLDTLGNVYYVE
ncbi:WG repeat-containing protein [Sediminitomix flava]|nr:WG repeat-containing protein [Sediminitomix flava]